MLNELLKDRDRLAIGRFRLPGLLKILVSQAHVGVAFRQVPLPRRILGIVIGPTLADAARPIALNHPHCARFCVLGGASCSAA